MSKATQHVTPWSMMPQGGSYGDGGRAFLAALAGSLPTCPVAAPTKRPRVIHSRR